MSCTFALDRPVCLTVSCSHLKERVGIAGSSKEGYPNQKHKYTCSQAAEWPDGFSSVRWGISRLSCLASFLCQPAPLQQGWHKMGHGRAPDWQHFEGCALAQTSDEAKWIHSYICHSPGLSLWALLFPWLWQKYLPMQTQAWACVEPWCLQQGPPAVALLQGLAATWARTAADEWGLLLDLGLCPCFILIMMHSGIL